MRRLFLLISLLVISTGWVLAQTNTRDNEATAPGSQATSGSDYSQSAAPQSSDMENIGTSSQEMSQQGAMSSQESQGGRTTTAGEARQDRTGKTKTIAGCLSESNGRFTLTDREGNAYQLSGKTSALKAHVGHEIRVTGRESTASVSQPGAMSGEQAGAMPTISVTSFKHISSSCKTSSSMH